MTSVVCDVSCDVCDAATVCHHTYMLHLQPAPQQAAHCAAGSLPVIDNKQIWHIYFLNWHPSLRPDYTGPCDDIIAKRQELTNDTCAK